MGIRNVLICMLLPSSDLCFFNDGRNAYNNINILIKYHQNIRYTISKLQKKANLYF